MTYTLAIGDRAYSSWSLRGWLLFEKFGLSAKTHLLDFNLGSVADQLNALGFAPARTVPSLRTPEGAIISESLAVAEELASRHPDAGHWPTDPKARAIARSITSEMHSGFAALRDACPMNLRLSYKGFEPAAEVLADLARLEDIWQRARSETRAEGPWLCGAYSIADVFFAPVATRIATYGLPVGPAAQAYVAAHLADPAFRRWRAMGLAKGAVLEWYKRDLPALPWPGPVPLVARASENGPAENSACPFSGEPVTHFLEIDGRVFGFCNAFCRDKTVADPLAWPKFAAIYQS